MPKENTQVIEGFMKRHKDPVCDLLDVEWGIQQAFGRQLLPSSEGHDGFYYARLIKA
jgi:16S rRNA (cytosine967-C5)-methyltransferase